MYECDWNNEFNTIMPLHSIKRYVNKVRASNASVLKYKQPTEELKQKYPRPSDNNNASAIINYNALIKITEEDFLTLNRTNAVLGPKCEIHCIVLTFDSSTGMDIANDILSAWQGPNKNELLIFIGFDKANHKASWVKVESWMDDTTINGYIVDGILNKDFDTKAYSLALQTIVPKYWKRKHFSDFDYLNVQIPASIIVTTLVLQLLSAVISTIVFVRNN
jgi:hypothetical protein